ncbi:ParB/RepB/Spo0J family partition protein [Bifidobacterium pseudocatenulatum]|uniref:ParB/RepB/Spo0J family partition protein n=1 Tax=Bifidobacterium pseudocatenulatum TaxID=28026 RepID=UPI001CFC4D55|nr:ParB/RepB/Spo0J family partition protein [Bifidobacterium pseudocatenulatum]MCB4915926.1 ParB/RepB/Spo0J family partition protein [Bifidobacterium pseudocatenulatum]
MSNYQSDQIKLINTSLIDPHPDNPRKNIGDVTDLAASIKANGLLSPLSVVPNGSRYRVIAGHRRLAACKQAGTGAVPCFVLQLGPLQQLEAMVTENCQREQLTVLEEADAIQGMLDLGATTANVAHRLGRSGDYVRDRVKAASIKTEVRATRDDFGQISIGQLVAIARYDGQPDRQKELAQAAGTSNFDYTLRRIERDDRDRQWVESVAALLGEPDSGINLIPDPEKPYSDPEWRYIGCMFPSTGTPEEAIEKIRELNPAAVSIHTVSQQVYLWTRRDTADAEKEARRAAEQAERDARRHALEEYAAASADKRMAWLHGHLHGVKRDKLVETTARLGLLQIIDPDPQGYTQALSTWNDKCGVEQFTTISGIEPERALAELRYHLDEPDWAVWAVQILAARIEWFIDPEDWTSTSDISRRIPGYYQILQDLGYTPADDETSHLDQLIAAITEADSDENEEDEENNQ